MIISLSKFLDNSYVLAANSVPAFRAIIVQFYGLIIQWMMVIDFAIDKRYAFLNATTTTTSL